MTKGDHNPTTDQRAGYPPVPREAVVGRVLTVRGEPVVLPHLGTVMRVARANAPALLVLAAGALAVAWRRSGVRRRDVPRVDDVFVPLFGVVSVATALLLAYGGSGHALTYVAVTPSTSAAGPNVVHVGASPPVSFTVRQPSLPLTHRLVDARGMAVTSVTRNASAVSVAGTLTPPATTGPTRVRVFVTPYPAVLPRWLLARLQGVHPLAAAATSTGTVLGPVWLCYRALLDPRAPLRASRSRWERLLREGFR